MTISKDEILEAISNMSVMDVMDLIHAMEKKFDISSSSIVSVSDRLKEEGKTEVVEKKTMFDVVMTSFGSNKISVIKVIREITGLGLREAKDLVEKIPVVVKNNLSNDESLDIKQKLEDVGASVEIK
ncbi:50S ribosomal protein L7/L12 [Candidatus Legionella polyplacis]|uniref:Large ribosomal subunit protein bL12 n=1 Tax=Candidatus Legionella polyplacis TaxID=2005262 RepID=A0ABZ2GZC7_9GAMM|nr:50S ribosomal protein L7/L12 [Candidatus Legionella polyplacis]ATW01771.1 50S ribosomal protein L7/L12 [Candidatus Legionella polyplacis]